MTLYSVGQTINVKKYYDKDSLHVKESFLVKQSAPTVLNGVYTSYYFNGNKRSEGEYKENNATGDWMFFYESEKIKMVGPLRENKSHGYWKYYFENGNLRMEGMLTESQKEGEWIYYHENGKLKSKGNYKNNLKEGIWMYYHETGEFKAQANYKHGKGEYHEFFEDGTVKMHGYIENEKSNGHWTYYFRSGNIESEGEERNGLKEGSWKFYYQEGGLKSEGQFEGGKANGNWKYYHENGNVKAQGSKINDNKTGYWKVMFETGKLQSEANYDNTETGTYEEYYVNGKLKVSGQYKNGKHDGHWKYYYEDGTVEGTCHYSKGKGYYKGFTHEGKIKIEGAILGAEKTGTWILYDENGEIAGYYHNYNKEQHPVFSAVTSKKNTLPSGSLHTRTKKDGWKNFQKTKLGQTFKSHDSEKDTYIFSIEPLAPILSQFTASYEYWVGKTFGHEIIAGYELNPPFSSHSSPKPGEVLIQGYHTAYRFKFYEQSPMAGFMHFDNELRFNQRNHTTGFLEESGTKINLIRRETNFEYTLMFGNRYMLSRNRNLKRYIGWTIDTYIGLGIGYRTYHNSWSENPEFDNLFPGTNGSNITVPVRLGLSVGYSF